MMYSVTQAAKLLKISRQAVLKRIKKGTLKAEKVGNVYAIPESEFKPQPKPKRLT